MGRYGTTTRYLLENLLPDHNKRLYRAALVNYVASNHEISARQLNNAFSRAIRQGLIIINEVGAPELTAKGRHAMLPFTAPTLPGSVLMIIFDIPEADRKKRDHLCLLLKELSFEQIQKSVWVTKFDHQEYLRAEIQALGLEKEVQLSEAKALI
ncbi:MAG: hypothetical protein U0520_03040 [Candidatus Saccharimonadales bacterium]